MVICRYCRTENRADATYCNNCGGALKPVPAPSVTSPRPTTPPAANGTGRLTPQSRLRGRYIILQVVGKGGMAAVYRAVDTRRNATVAIKEMSQDGLSPDDLRDALASFRSEAEMLANLRHRNLPRVYESFTENTRQYLVMDFIEGETLEQRQQRMGNGPLPPAEVLGWAKQLCSVLGYLHSQRPPIIFRDLKPANIMLTRDGQIKLVDFGIARVFAPGHTRDTQVLGTPGYAPPEQYGKSQTDPRADIYALGCTLYQLLSGYDPSTTPFQLPPLHTRVSGIAPQVERAIEHATRLDRDQRPPTVAIFSDELLGSGGVRPTMPYQAVPPSTARQPAQSAAMHAAAHAAPTAPTAPLIQPQSLDFGRLIAGQQGALSMTISAPPGGRAHGKLKALTPWITLDHSRFDGQSTIIRVTADTHKMTTAGVARGNIQVICDGQQIYIPVSVDIAPVPAQAKASVTPGKSGAKGGTARPVPAKYLMPRPPRSGTAQMLIVGMLAAIVAGGIFHALNAVVVQILRWPETAPLIFAQMLLATAVAALAALLAAGGPNLRARLGTTFVAAYAGLALALLVSVTPPRESIQRLATMPVQVPEGLLLLMPALVGAGAMLGASQFHSRWMLTTARIVSRYAPFFVTVGGIVGGAYLGFMLTQHVLLGCLVPFGIGAGIFGGIILARGINSLLRRMGRMPANAGYPRPRMPRYRPYSGRWP